MSTRTLTKADLWPMAKQTVSDFFADKAPKQAAALAYYTIFSVGPLLVITVAVVGLALGQEAATGQVKQQLQSLVGGKPAEGIQEMIQISSTKGGTNIFAIAFSAVVLLFTASGVFGELQDSLNTVWEVKPKPNLGIWATVKSRFLSMTMVLGIAFLLLVSMAVSTVITAVSTKLLGGLAALSHATDLLLSIAVATVLFAAIYKVLPDVTVQWRDVRLGAFFTAILFSIGKILLGVYLSLGATGSASGAAGSLLALLVWIYYSSWILFLGAEFTQVYAKRAGTPIVAASNAEPITPEQRTHEGAGVPKTTSYLAATKPVAAPRIAAPLAPTRASKPTSHVGANTAVANAAGFVAGALIGSVGVYAATSHAVARRTRNRLDGILARPGSIRPHLNELVRAARDEYRRHAEI